MELTELIDFSRVKPQLECVAELYLKEVETASGDALTAYLELLNYAMMDNTSPARRGLSIDIRKR